MTKLNRVSNRYDVRNVLASTLLDFDDLFKRTRVDDVIEQSKTTNFRTRYDHDNTRMELSLDLPCVKKEDLDVTFESDDRVVIEAKRYDDGKTTRRCVFTLEGRWSRETAEATLCDGVLTLTFTLDERARPRKLTVR